jgi:para-aminobenzoate synthetase component I
LTQPGVAAASGRRRRAPSAVDDPFRFFAHLRTGTRNCAILESLGDHGEATARWSFVGAVPREELVAVGGRSWLVGPAGDAREVGWLDVLDAWCPIGTGPPDPVQTGAIGYVGYDLDPAGEGRTPRRPADAGVPDLHLVRYGAVLVFDRSTGRAAWAHDDDLEPHVAALEDRWASEWRQAPPPEVPLRVFGDVVPDFDVQGYLDAVRSTVARIRAGDLFQANVTGRFSARYAGDLFACYSLLRSLTPNPFFAFLDFAEPLLSTSPERFVAVAGRRITSSPIKGTARCTVGRVDQRAALLASAKDVAENTMIVDVARNDLGRVCRRGSVTVDALCEAKRFNHLYHLESTVSGDLADGVTVSDVLAATFPPASISGAPKIKATEVIAEVEQTRRGPYCGAVGFFGADGWVDTSVAIRVLYAGAGRVHFHAGGGIVADSVPEAERDELLLKTELVAAALRSFDVLAPLRAAIDDVDDRLFALLGERFGLVRRVAEVKERHGIPNLQDERVASMVAAREAAALAGGTVPVGLVRDLYEVLVRHAMAVEEAARRDGGPGGPPAGGGP